MPDVRQDKNHMKFDINLHHRAQISDTISGHTSSGGGKTISLFHLKILPPQDSYGAPQYSTKQSDQTRSVDQGMTVRSVPWHLYGVYLFVLFVA